MKALTRWLAVFLVFITFFSIPDQVGAQDVQLITNSLIEYSFGQQVTFIAELPEGLTPVGVQVFFRPKGDTNTVSGQAVLEPGRAVYIHDLARQSLRPFAEIEYWFSTTMVDGTSQVSQVFSFYYEDNRFAWKSLQDGLFRVHWYEGDITFGQMILDVARTGLQKAKQLFDYPELELVDIYAYANGNDLRSSMQLVSLPMVAGHADPALGLMIVSLPSGPGERMETGRQVPHELVHILLYQKLGARYAILPTWLNEGLASVNEENANPFYSEVLDEAAAQKTLLPMSQLCNGFPPDAANYYLSYAQSKNFVDYILKTYGVTKLETLISQYADGIACEIAPETVFGSNLTELDRAWREQEFGYNTKIEVVAPMFPWLTIGAVSLLAPFILLIVFWLRSGSKKSKRSI